VVGVPAASSREPGALIASRGSDQGPGAPPGRERQDQAIRERATRGTAALGSVLRREGGAASGESGGEWRSSGALQRRSSEVHCVRIRRGDRFAPLTATDIKQDVALALPIAPVVGKGKRFPRQERRPWRAHRPLPDPLRVDSRTRPGRLARRRAVRRAGRRRAASPDSARDRARRVAPPARRPDPGV